MGKTSITFASAMKSCYENGKKGAFISLEMSKVQLQNRVIAEITGIDYRKIKALSLTQEEYDKVEKLYDWFDDKSNLKVYDRNDCSSITDIYNLLKSGEFDFGMIDYIQLITLDGKVKSKVGNREQEISEISRALKAMTTEFDIPIIALAQLSRSVESRPNKRPILSDLRESGSWNKMLIW